MKIEIEIPDDIVESVLTECEIQLTCNGVSINGVSLNPLYKEIEKKIEMFRRERDEDMTICLLEEGERNEYDS